MSLWKFPFMLRSTHERILKEQVSTKAWELNAYLFSEYKKMYLVNRGANRGIVRLNKRIKDICSEIYKQGGGNV